MLRRCVAPIANVRRQLNIKITMQETLEISLELFLKVCEMIVKYGSYDSVLCRYLTTPTPGNTVGRIVA